mmetsp:Transcript_4873/g.22341  ORF Transcript_4873/g.22341 Transcript_4873/m.22341 type:complete len:364 (-) Transcript_4873:121-1212(-)
MRESLTHCTFTSSTSKMSVALPGMAPFTPFLPYAIAGGMVSRRLSPTRMPATPTSQPLMTSPMPSLNWKVALPLVWSKILPLWSLPTYFIVTLLPGSAFLPSTWPIATLRISMPFLNSRLSCLPPEAGVSGLGASFFFSSFFSFLAGGSSFLAGGSSGAARFFFSSFLLTLTTPPPPPSPLGANREPAPGGLKTGDAATMGEGSGPGDGAKGDGAKGATTLDVGLNTGDGAAATGAATTGAATDDVVIFVALGVNLAAAAGLDATGDGAKGKGPSETVEAFPEDSMLSVRWSADPGGTAVRTGLRLAIFVMSFSGETTSGVGAAATDAGASPEPRSSRSPPDSHASSAIDSMRRPRWVVPVRR